MTLIAQWATRHGVSPLAVRELWELMNSPIIDSVHGVSGSEAAGQQRIKLEAPKQGVRLWRNNVGACIDENGNYIRYGLANESKAMNAKIKSSDLIGITPITVTGPMVGGVLGVFTAYECKKPGWKHNPNNKREQAQNSFMQLVIGMGGIAQFATDPKDIWS